MRPERHASNSGAGRTNRSHRLQPHPWDGLTYPDPRTLDIIGRYIPPIPDLISGTSVADIPVDVVHRDHEMVVRADVPGFERNELDVSVDGDLLTIRAVPETETESDGAYVRRERRHHAMRRTVRLPADADRDGAAATYRNGVLVVTVPLVEDGRHISID